MFSPSFYSDAIHGHISFLLKENIRQKCLFNLLPVDEKVYWYSFMNEFIKECYRKDSTTLQYLNRECSDRVLDLVYGEFSDIN